MYPNHPAFTNHPAYTPTTVDPALLRPALDLDILVPMLNPMPQPPRPAPWDRSVAQSRTDGPPL